MSQSRWDSFMEANVSTAVGFVVAWLVQQYIITPLFHTGSSAGDNFMIVTIFTVASLLRGYAVRRYFVYRAQRRAS